MGSEGDKLLTEAAEKAVKVLESHRTRSNKKKAPRQKRQTIADVFRVEYDKLLPHDENDIPTDDGQLLSTVIEKLSSTDSIASRAIGGVPACKVLADRIDRLEWPEFHLLAALVISDAVDLDLAAQRWLASVCTGEEE